MTLTLICIIISSLSFYAYVVSYFISPHMKNEFKRFNLEKLGLLTIILELLGATGLLIGLKFNLILTMSSFGLGLLMLCGLVVRIKLKDSTWKSLPVMFFMILNLYIFLMSIK
jgi:hypothetical protein